ESHDRPKAQVLSRTHDHLPCLSTDHRLHQNSVQPRLRIHFWAFSMISSNANSTSSGALRPNRITPASVLWSKSGEETFKTNGPAISPAKDRASAALRARPPCGTASPQAFSSSFASTSLKALRP